MLQKCIVKVVGKKVVCDGSIESKEKLDSKSKTEEAIKNKKKLHHLNSIGMDLTKYHPSILKVMIDGGRLVDKIPNDIKHQLIDFATEAKEKGFNRSMFGHNTTLDKHIKAVHNLPTRPYVKKHVKFAPKIQGGNPANIKMEVVHTDNSACDQSSSSESSSESEPETETDIDGVLSSVERDIKGGRITAGKQKIKRIKHRIPKSFFNKIIKSMEGL